MSDPPPVFYPHLKHPQGGSRILGAGGTGNSAKPARVVAVLNGVSGLCLHFPPCLLLSSSARRCVASVIVARWCC